MVSCCVFCASKQGTEGKTHHKFPLKQPEILRSWLQNMGLGSYFVPKIHSLLCSDHFEQKCFQEGANIKCLRSGSIPTLFREYKSVCVYCHALKGQDKRRSFRKFPLGNPGLLQKWIMAMELKGFIPNEQSLLCSDHFEEKCLRSSGRGLVLRANAVPTLFSSEDNRGTTIETHEQISNSPDEVDDINRNQSTICQQGTKRISCEFSTSPSKIRRSGRPSTSISMNSENEVRVDRSAIEHRDENSAPSTCLAAQKMNSPVRSRTPETPMGITKRILPMKHDHQYAVSPNSMRKTLARQQKRIKVLTRQAHVQRQHISRLKKKVTSLKDIVRELPKTHAIPDSGLQCLDAIASADVSQFLKRFIHNQNKPNKENDKANNNSKKRNWKCRRKNKEQGISREMYPAALRSFAMTLHFYSLKAYGFVRRKFCKALPNPSTLRSWHMILQNNICAKILMANEGPLI